MLSFKSSADAGKSVVFYSPPLKMTSKQSSCAIRFWYYMYGDVNQMANSRLNLYTQDFDLNQEKKLVWSGSMNKDFPQQWIRFVSQSYVGNFRFIFEGVLGTGVASSIAIDDISYSEGCSLGSSILPTRPTHSTTTITTTRTHSSTKNTQSTQLTFGTDTTADTDLTVSTTIKVDPTKSLLDKNGQRDKPSHGKKKL